MNDQFAKYIDDHLDLIRAEVGEELTPSEFEQFIVKCKAFGLDPLRRQIYVTKRWDSQKKTMKMMIEPTIDGLRAIADRTGERDGEAQVRFCDADGNWSDCWYKDGYPRIAEVVVRRKGHSMPYHGQARWESYAQYTKTGELTRPWAKMPELMLAKCAEALALRKAFPNEMAGLYTREEMMQAESPTVSRVQNAPDVPGSRCGLVLIESEKWDAMSADHLNGLSFDEVDDEVLMKLAKKSDEVLGRWGVGRLQ